MFEKENAPRVLVRRTVGERELLELLLGHLRPLSRNDKGIGYLSLEFVVEREDTRLVAGRDGARAVPRLPPGRYSRRPRRTCHRCAPRSNKSRPDRGGRYRRCNTSRPPAASR